MDFVTGLPKTPRNFDAILVFTDKLTKMIHLCPTTTTCTALEAAVLLRDNVIRLHGLPRALVSDRDKVFRAKLYQEIVTSYGIRHGFSTSHHPQTDGQTERVNRVMEDYLRHYVRADQSDWDEHLAMAEFAFNNAVHESTQTTPFLLNYGLTPLTPLSFLMQRQAKTLDAFDFQCPAAQAFTEDINKRLSTAKKWLEAAQNRQKANADKSRRNVEFAVGDEVLISTANLYIQTGGTRKLLPRFIGPYPITRVINSNAYKIQLPDELKCHNVFNISCLKRYLKGDDHQPAPPPILVEGELEWFVEQLTSHRHRSHGAGRTKKLEFLVKWRGCGPENNTWESLETVQDCEVLDDYLAAHPTLNLKEAPKAPKRRR
jgi:hypothetical protein